MTTENETQEWTRGDSEQLARDILPILVKVAALDRDKLVRGKRALERFEAAAPVLDPTAYKKRGGANTRAMRRLDALIDFYDALDVDEWLEEAGDA